ncbi:MAG: hypothetical protein H7Z42_21010 [Roseiflexaceae bacterium]|nr:hypothetical protein [Roseiflexaceae bacterium]
MNRIHIAGLAAMLGGVALFADLALRLFSGFGPAYFILAVPMALCLAGAPLGLRMLSVVAAGWRNILAWSGTAITLLGVALWLIAFVTLFFNPAAAFTQRLTPGGSLLLAVGMVVLGVAVLASRRLPGWRRFAPLAVGLYFPLQLVFQLAFFLNGRDGAPGPNGALLGAWGLLWALVGYGIFTSAQPTKRGSMTQAVRTSV